MDTSEAKLSIGALGSSALPSFFSRPCLLLFFLFFVLFPLSGPTLPQRPGPVLLLFRDATCHGKTLKDGGTFHAPRDTLTDPHRPISARHSLEPGLCTQRRHRWGGRGRNPLGAPAGRQHSGLRRARPSGRSASSSSDTGALCFGASDSGGCCAGCGGIDDGGDGCFPKG